VKKLETPSLHGARVAAAATLLLAASLGVTGVVVHAHDSGDLAGVASGSASAAIGSDFGSTALPADDPTLRHPASDPLSAAALPSEPAGGDPTGAPAHHTGPPTSRSTQKPTPPSTLSPTPPPTSSPTPPPADGIIHTDGSGHLTLNGARYQFTGVNAFELATWWGTNFGCGAQIDDLDGFFNSLTPNSVVRFWAFQDFTQSKSTGGRDWGPIDRVVQSAERTHQRLLFVLGDQWANCHGEQYKDAAFYSGGYKTGVPPGELETYWSWVRDVVSRYRSSSAVGMWEPLNEAQGDCNTIWRDQLRQFFDSVGGLIKSIDNKHLVESGVLGTGQCGITGPDYVIAQDTPNIDVVSYHDYADSSPLPGSLAQRLLQAQQLNKPLIVGEVGFLSDCATMQAKWLAQFAAGVAGFMPWNWNGPWMGVCGF